MSGRISTQALYLQSLASMLNQQAALARTQQQVGTGRRFATAADDPVAASRELDLNRSLGRLAQLKQNISVANHRLGLEDNALAEVTDTLQRVRELAVLANSDTNEGSRDVIVEELNQLLGHLVQTANASDGEGGYLFSGFSADGQPFVRDNTVVQYRGDQGQRFLQIGPERRVADSDSGAAVFQFVRNGNGSFTTAAASENSGSAIIDNGAVRNAGAWVPGRYEISFGTANDYEVKDDFGAVVASGTYEDGGVISFNGIDVSLSGPAASGDLFVIEPAQYQDIFAMVQGFIDTATGQSADSGARAIFHSEMNTVLGNLDQALEHIARVRTRVGTRLSALDDQQQMNLDSKLSLETTLSDVRDIDLIEAASRLDLERVALQAAQQAFLRVQNLSLFRLLG
ncbi:MAG: flagellar hook-associated protein FlgL [Gammaproteobacteria bacterium]|nr:flagellar hook-associated protein FlgL [Gammaproteobacteria bacterium]NNF61203.1 flagellar hook-associated protein FlgL [Gammaproteobacteria bacterium]NNM19952.1 flagellar hook-associated protein FlgL [Gammaproteobacteria bacterium]